MAHREDEEKEDTYNEVPPLKIGSLRFIHKYAEDSQPSLKVAWQEGL